MNAHEKAVMQKAGVDVTSRRATVFPISRPKEIRSLRVSSRDVVDKMGNIRVFPLPHLFEGYRTVEKGGSLNQLIRPPIGRRFRSVSRPT